MNFDDFEDFFIMWCGAASIVLLEETNTRRSVWVRDWVLRRKKEGCCAKLLKELREETPLLYKNFLRMEPDDFNHLLKLVSPLITKMTTGMREAISAAERLSVTLRFLVTGDSFRSLQYLFRIPFNTISVIIPEVCDAIYQVLQPQYLKVRKITKNNEIEFSLEPVQYRICKYIGRSLST